MSFVCNIQLFQHFLPLSYNFVRESLNLKDSPGVEIMLLFAAYLFSFGYFREKDFPTKVYSMNKYNIQHALKVEMQKNISFKTNLSQHFMNPMQLMC